jgi:hypothetical protein
MLGQMADSGHTDDPTASSGAPPDQSQEGRPPGTQGGDLVAADDASGEATAQSIKRPSSVALLADLERRVRRLESRVDGLESSVRGSRRGVRASDLVRWGLWLVVIGFLAFLWLRMMGSGHMGVPR